MKYTKKKVNKKINNNSVIYKTSSNNKTVIKAKIVLDDDFENMINSLMSSELVYGDNNYY